jgi:senataxin
MKIEMLGPAFPHWLRSSFNESQQVAIASAATGTGNGFTLIKGPPGTGKTTTLCGLLNSLHLRQYNLYFKSLLEQHKPRGVEDTQTEAKAIAQTTAGMGKSMDEGGTADLTDSAAAGAADSANVKPEPGLAQRGSRSRPKVTIHRKPHILVTAPSNAAVDGIVEKLMAEGFRDGNGE